MSQWPHTFSDSLWVRRIDPDDSSPSGSDLSEVSDWENIENFESPPQQKPQIFDFESYRQRKPLSAIKTEGAGVGLKISTTPRLGEESQGSLNHSTRNRPHPESCSTRSIKSIQTPRAAVEDNHRNHSARNEPSAEHGSAHSIRSVQTPKATGEGSQGSLYHSTRKESYPQSDSAHSIRSVQAPKAAGSAPTAAGSTYFQSEAYKKRKQRRLEALKSVRTTFRGIMDKSTEPGTKTSTPLALAAQIKALEMEKNEKEGNILVAPLNDRRLEALKSVRTTFRGIMDKSTEPGTKPSTPLALAAQIKALEMKKKNEKERNILVAPLNDDVVKPVKPTTAHQIPPPSPPPPPPPPTLSGSLSISTLGNGLSKTRRENNTLWNPNMCIQEELDSANALIEVQAQQIQELKNSVSLGMDRTNNSFLSSNSPYNLFTSHLDPRTELLKLKRHLVQVQMNRALEQYIWKHETSENAKKYQHQLAQYQKEIQDWRIRFEEAENEHQRQIEDLKDKTKQANNELMEAQLQIARLVIGHQVALQESQSLKAQLAKATTPLTKSRLYAKMNDALKNGKMGSTTRVSEPMAGPPLTHPNCRKGKGPVISSGNVNTMNLQGRSGGNASVSCYGQAPGAKPSLLYERSREKIRSRYLRSGETDMPRATGAKPASESNCESLGTQGYRRFAWRNIGVK